MAKQNQDRAKTGPGKLGRKLGLQVKVFLFYAVAACLMFVLGVYVGRGTSPIQYDIPDIEFKVQEVLTGLEKETLQQKEELAVYEEAREEARGEVQEGGNLESQQRPVKVIRARSSSTKKPLTGNEMALVNPPAATAPPAATTPRTVSSDTSTTRQTTAAPAAQAQTGKWTIQVAAYKSKDEAAVNQKKLKDKGFDAHVVEARVASGAVWYRLRVGKFTDRASAAKVRDRLVSGGASEAYILKDD